MKVRTILGALITTFATTLASAGAVNGGGGIAVVCRDLSGQILKAELLDLYEAKRRGLVLMPACKMLDCYNLFMERWIRYNGATPMDEPDEVVQKYIDAMLARTYFTKPGEMLPRTSDYTTEPPPQGCSYEQAAYFDDKTVKTSVQTEIWEHLDDQNRMALLAHELIFYNYRLLYKHRTSDVARILTGQFFSTTPPTR